MHKYISFIDLQTNTTTNKLLLAEDWEGIDKVLYGFGFDTQSDSYTMEECLHRPLSSKDEVYGLRWNAKERMDDEWMDSGNASFEAKLIKQGDKGMMDSLAAVSGWANHFREMDYDEESV